MPIIHVKKNSHNYRRDTRLSWKARGILAYLLQHEDDWEVSVQDLVAQSTKDGRMSVQSALQELLKMKVRQTGNPARCPGQSAWQILCHLSSAL
jgi:hypothetical protein